MEQLLASMSSKHLIRWDTNWLYDEWMGSWHLSYSLGFTTRAPKKKVDMIVMYLSHPMRINIALPYPGHYITSILYHARTNLLLALFDVCKHNAYDTDLRKHMLAWDAKIDTDVTLTSIQLDNTHDWFHIKCFFINAIDLVKRKVAGMLLITSLVRYNYIWARWLHCTVLDASRIDISLSLFHHPETTGYLTDSTETAKYPYILKRKCTLLASSPDPSLMLLACTSLPVIQSHVLRFLQCPDSVLFLGMTLVCGRWKAQWQKEQTI